LRCIGLPARFLYRQTVHVRPECNAGTFLFRIQHSDHSGSRATASYSHSGYGFQGFSNDPRCPVLLVSDFRIPVQIPPDLLDPGQDFGNSSFQIKLHGLSRICDEKIVSSLTTPYPSASFSFAFQTENFEKEDIFPMKLFRIAGAFLLIALLFFAGLAFFQSPIIRKSVQTAGPALADVPTTLASASINPLSGELHIKGLEIGNPEGFSSDPALRVGEFLLDVAPSTAMAPVIHVEKLLLTDSVILSEGLLADNQRTILKNLRSRFASDPSSGPQKPDSNKKESTQKIRIDTFAFTNNRFILKLDGKVVTEVAFPDIILNNIGDRNSAVTVSDAAIQIYQAIISETTKTLTYNPDVLKAIANAKLQTIGIRDLKDLKNPKDLLKNPEVVGSLLESIGNAIESSSKPSEGH
jgi:hypothetical protein